MPDTEVLPAKGNPSGREAIRRLGEQLFLHEINGLIAVTEKGDLPPSRLLRKAYEFSWSCGAGVIDSLDLTGQAGKVIAGTSKEAKPMYFSYDDSDSNSNIAGSYRPTASSITINPDAFMTMPDKIGNVELREGEGKLFNFLRIMGHETGHAILGGIGAYSQRSELKLNGISSTDDYIATRSYLKADPKAAFTGHWETDARIHEERFAEGYGRMIVGEAAEMLGYTDEQIIDILAGLDLSTTVDGERGANQLDHIKSLQPDHRIGELVLSQEAEQPARGMHDYDGYLGYALPLKPEEVTRQLATLGKIFEDNDMLDPSMNDESWKRLVQQHQAKQVKRHVKKLGTARRQELIKLEAELHPWRYAINRLGKGTIVSAAASSMLLGAAVDILNDASTMPEQNHTRIVPRSNSQDIKPGQKVVINRHDLKPVHHKGR